MDTNDCMVNHPSHYEKAVTDNRLHPECIELLDVITQGLPGIIALDIGQLKYLYRFGSKAEEGMTKREKAIQDVEKIGWYAEDAKKRWFNYSDLITQKPVTPAIYTTALLVAEEFAFDKPELLKNLVRAVIVQAMLLTTKERNIVKYCDCVNALIEAAKATTDEDWN